MAVEVEKLVAVLEANVTKFQKALDKASSGADRSFNKIERRGKQMESRMASLGRGLTIGRGLFAAFAGSAALRGMQQFIDASTRMGNALKAAGLQGEDFRRVQAGLFAAANRNAAPVETLTELYARLSLVQKELGVDSDRLLAFTDKVALALRAGGQTASEASGALLQLSQALGSGVVRAEEFNSVLEGAPAIAQAVAAGLEEAGGSVARLRQLVIDGEISSEAFFAAFEAGAVILEQRVAGANLTVEQSLNLVNNALVEAAGKFDAVTGASAAAAELLERLAGVITGLSNVFAAAAEGPIGAFISRLSQVNDMIKTIMPGMQALGLISEQSLNGIAVALGGAGASGGGGSGGATQSEIQAAIDKAFSFDALPAKAVKPVSLKQFAAPVSKKKSGGSGGGKKTPKIDDYQQEIKAVQEKTAALNAETTALSQLNPLQADYAFQAEKARIAEELLTAAKKAGLAITPELMSQIEGLSSAYASAAVNADQLSQAQDDAAQTASDMASFGKDIISGFISDLRAGKTAAEAFANALEKIADKALDLALSAIFDGGGFGGLLSWMFGFSKGGLVKGFAGGGYTGHGGKHQPAGVVHKGEYVINKAATQQIGVAALDRINRGYADGGLVTSGDLNVPASMGARPAAANANYAPVFNIDARGADQAAVARLERSLNEFARTEGKRIDARMEARQVRRTRA